MVKRGKEHNRKSVRSKKSGVRVRGGGRRDKRGQPYKNTVSIEPTHVLTTPYTTGEGPCWNTAGSFKYRGLTVVYSGGYSPLYGQSAVSAFAFFVLFSSQEPVLA